jgi:hypothetical protein
MKYLEALEPLLAAAERYAAITEAFELIERGENVIDAYREAEADLCKAAIKYSKWFSYERGE